MERCRGTTKAGRRCRRDAEAGSGFCMYHKPSDSASQCRGTTVAGLRCKISWELDANGYCEWHTSQFEGKKRPKPAKSLEEKVPFYEELLLTPDRLVLSLVQESVEQKRVDITNVDGSGESLLHVAVTQGYVNVVEWLFSKADELGVKVDALNTSGRTPLQEVLLRRDLDTQSTFILVELLLRNNASPVGQREGVRWSPLRCLLERFQDKKEEADQDPVEDAYRLACLIVSHGATADEDFDRVVDRIGAKELLGIKQYVNWWASLRQAYPDADLHDVSLDAIRQGPEEVDKVMKVEEARLHDKHTSNKLYARSRICVIGSSIAGKTSFIKSVKSCTPTLEPEADRTIGIDIHLEEFIFQHQVDGKDMTHKVTFWDFAGQNEYQVAHGLFFTERTIYVLCIDVHQYVQLYRGGTTHSLDVFVASNVIPWLEMVYFRFQSLTLVMVWTKTDEVPGFDCNEIKNDLQRRLDTWTKMYSKKPIKVSPRQWITVSNKVADEVKKARKDLETVVREVIQSDDSSIGEGFNKVFQFIKQAAMGSVETLVDKDTLVHKLHREYPDVDGGEQLKVLCDLGYVLSYHDCPTSNLSERMILDPKLLLNLLKGVINHTNRETYLETGVLRHRDLTNAQSWSRFHDIDPADTRYEGDALKNECLAFKQLFQHYLLVLPASGPMAWDSDLVMPALLKPEQGDCRWAFRELRLTAAQPKTMEWRYGALPPFVARSLYIKFVAAARSITRAEAIWVHNATRAQCVLDEEFDVRIKSRGEASTHTLRPYNWIHISVTTSDKQRTWEVLSYFVTAMEKLLSDMYDNLQVKRQVSTTELVGKDYAEILAEVRPPNEEGMELRMKEKAWQSLDFTWYTSKKWWTSGERQKWEYAAFIERRRETIDRTQHDAALPALWRARYHPHRVWPKLELFILCEVSGDCVHGAIEMSLSHQLAKYPRAAKLIKTVSRCVPCIGEELAEGIGAKADEGAVIRKLFKSLDLRNYANVNPCYQGDEKTERRDSQDGLRKVGEVVDLKNDAAIVEFSKVTFKRDENGAPYWAKRDGSDEKPRAWPGWPCDDTVARKFTVRIPPSARQSSEPGIGCVRVKYKLWLDPPAHDDQTEGCVLEGEMEMPAGNQEKSCRFDVHKDMWTNATTLRAEAECKLIKKWWTFSSFKGEQSVELTDSNHQPLEFCVTARATAHSTYAKYRGNISDAKDADSKIPTIELSCSVTTMGPQQ